MEKGKKHLVLMSLQKGQFSVARLIIRTVVVNRLWHIVASNMLPWANDHYRDNDQYYGVPMVNVLHKFILIIKDNKKQDMIARWSI
jgi:hypothetical protein